ncbi:relaxase/mobilization nuclease domain-containing protein [Altererythrobacter sp. MTPC7]|uniref:relaxase/mobilization nuclease domain-containing protein n=1 Tax=Altererythrobacter sp. MTPC7 TaxID=3056567 RepID=UPI0036F3DAC6
MFDAFSDEADGDAFAARCEDDRHHFRFIVSPEDASEMADLRAFTRELLEDMASDLDTRLDWVAVDHWNTDNPHVHVLVRGVASDGKDLVIDRSYISEGMRARAQERVNIELGPRSERDIQLALRREVDAERWTSLDRRLQEQRDDLGVVDLRPEVDATPRSNRAFLIGRARTLERMGLAERVGSARWTLAADCEPTLRALGERSDIIKTLHKAMSGRGAQGALASFALHGEDENRRVIGRLVERGLHNELTGEAYAIVEGVDGRAHFLRFPDLDQTSDAAPGAIVETSEWTNRQGRRRESLLVRSDLPLDRQIDARGATWLDRQLLSPRAEPLGGGFGNEVRQALNERREWLVDEGLAKRHGKSVTLVRNLLGTLRKQELDAAGEALAARHVHLANPVTEGDHISGIYRERISLASGRFAMINDGLCFQLVPWRRDLERHLGEEITGKANARGGIDWSFARSPQKGI